MSSTPHENKENRVIHEVDGIQEYDNRLPNWWLYTLFGSILFAGGYWLYFHAFEWGETPSRAYKREMSEIAAKAGKTVVLSSDEVSALANDSALIKDGASVFATTCTPCHGANGGGTVGPNLTDTFWIHGGSPESIYTTIREGFPAKGMPSWGPQLGDKRTQAVTAYVLSLRNTNVAGGKDAQGERYDGK